MSLQTLNEQKRLALGKEHRRRHRDLHARTHTRATHTHHGVARAHASAKDDSRRKVDSMFEPYACGDPLTAHVSAKDDDATHHVLADTIEEREKLSHATALLYADSVVNRRCAPSELVFAKPSVDEKTIGEILEL